jgi:hypothetical protein
VAVPPKGGQPAKDEPYMLSEGQRQDDIEVTKIDEASATITFNNHGTIQELPLVAAQASGPTGGGVPANPAGGPAGLPRFHSRPGGFQGNSPMPFGGGAQIPPPVDNNNGNMNPVGGPNFGGNAPNPQSNPETSNLTPEQKILVIEANRMATQDQVNKGFMPPLPPTVMTPDDATGQGGAPLITPPQP